MNIRTLIISAATVAMFAACGGDDDDSANTQANPAAASATIDQMAGLRDAFASSDGASAATAAYSLGASAQGIVTLAPSEAGRVEPGSYNVTGTCECSGDSCTFTDCGDDLGTWTINGTISRSGDTFSVDIEMTVSQSGYEWTWSQEGSMTITDTSIDGTMAGSGDGVFDDQMGGSVTVGWDWDMSANDITLDGTGCAVGGSMDASVSYDAGGQGGSASFSGSASVEFGPACGQVTEI